MIRIGIVLGCALVSTTWIGCGGSDADSIFGSPAASSSSSSSSASGGAGSTAASTGGGGSASASTSGGGADDRIDPITPGRSWTYAVEELGTYPLCPSGMQTGAVQSESMVDGKDAFSISSVCANAGASYYAVDGDVVQVDYQGTWILALDAPVEEGHTWSNGASTFTWHASPDVTVPAGTFTGCWSATENVASSSFTIFCRGVGPVHWHSEDASGNGFDATLTAKSP